jgi:hypothetical protein
MRKQEKGKRTGAASIRKKEEESIWEVWKDGAKLLFRAILFSLCVASEESTSPRSSGSLPVGRL